MTVVHFKPYIMTLTPGKNPAAAAERVARYIVDQWMPNHAGGPYLLIVPQLAQAVCGIYEKATKPVPVRVSLHPQVHLPLLEVL